MFHCSWQFLLVVSIHGKSTIHFWSTHIHQPLPHNGIPGIPGSLQCKGQTVGTDWQKCKDLPWHQVRMGVLLLLFLGWNDLSISPGIIFSNLWHIEPISRLKETVIASCFFFASLCKAQIEFHWVSSHDINLPHGDGYCNGFFVSQTHVWNHPCPQGSRSSRILVLFFRVLVISVPIFRP